MGTGLLGMSLTPAVSLTWHQPRIRVYGEKFSIARRAAVDMTDGRRLRTMTRLNPRLLMLILFFQ